MAKRLFASAIKTNTSALVMNKKKTFKVKNKASPEKIINPSRKQEVSPETVLQVAYFLSGTVFLHEHADSKTQSPA